MNRLFEVQGTSLILLRPPFILSFQTIFYLCPTLGRGWLFASGACAPADAEKKGSLFLLRSNPLQGAKQGANAPFQAFR